MIDVTQKPLAAYFDVRWHYIAMQELGFAAVVHDPRVVDDALQWQALCLDFVHVDITGQLWNTHT